MPLAKKVLKIAPPVPRRMGGKEVGDDSSMFHLKFKSEDDRTEVNTELHVYNYYSIGISGVRGAVP